MRARVIFVFAVVVLCCSCFAGANADIARGKSAPILDCPSEKLKIDRYDLDGHVGWSASGCGREADCYWRSENEMSCEETEASVRRITEAAVIDRLSIETDCAAERIKIMKRGAWSSAGQTSFRIEACGKPYVCTSGHAGMDCKPAMDQPQATDGGSSVQ